MPMGCTFKVIAFVDLIPVGAGSYFATFDGKCVMALPKQFCFSGYYWLRRRKESPQGVVESGVWADIGTVPLTLVIDGEKGWWRLTKESGDLCAEAMAIFRRLIYCYWVCTAMPLKDKLFSVAPLGESRVDDCPAVGTKVSRTDNPDVDLYFAKGSGLPLSATLQTSGREGSAARLFQFLLRDFETVEEVAVPSVCEGSATHHFRFFMSEFKTIEGVNVPTELKGYWNERPFLAAISDFQFVDRLDDQLFVKPKPAEYRPPWKDLSPNQRAAISQRWRDEGSRFVRDLNAFEDRYYRLGAEQAGREPEETRYDLAETVLEAVREANESGEVARLREEFPPAYPPFVGLLNENGQVLAPMFWLDGGEIVVRVGASQGEATTYQIDGLHLRKLPGILSFGRSPDRRYYAVARESDIAIHDGWDGPKVTILDWPTVGTRGGVQEVTQLVPFPDGKRVLLATPHAILVLEPERRIVLYPREPDKLEDKWLNNPHGAVSPDGSLIAIGDRLTCAHLIFNDRYQVVGEIAGLVDLAPWHASFSDDGGLLALSSFMLHQGATVLVPTGRFPGLVVGEEDLRACWYSKATWAEMRQGLREFDNDLVVLDSRASAYASAWRPGEFILGDAQGSLWAFHRDGGKRWYHFIGSSVFAIDVSPDGRQLIASTYAGLLVILDLDTGEADPYRIGTSTHRERRRWLFWKKEKRPLAW
jgi:hypothetical protein